MPRADGPSGSASTTASSLSSSPSDALLLRLSRAAQDVGAMDSVDAWRRASVRLELARAMGEPDRVAELAASYDRLLAMAPSAHPDGAVRWLPVPHHERRRLGAFATPPDLAAAMVDRALRLGDPSDRLPTIVDPACGAGALLLAALDRLVALAIPADRALTALHGVDVDPLAVELTRARLVARAAGLAGSDGSATNLERTIVVGNALADSLTMDWRRTFSSVLGGLGGSGELGIPGEPDPVTGWVGGFDVVLANPPWERLKVAADEHEDHGTLHRAREETRELVRQVREGGRHPLTGSGDLNAHLPFAETCWRLLAAGGRAALLLPASAVTDRQAGRLIQSLLAAGDLESVHVLHRPVRFSGAAPRVALITLCRNASGPRAARVVTGVRDAQRVEAEAGRAWHLDEALLRTVNPSSRSAVLFASRRDVDLVRGMHERSGVLLERDEPGAIVSDPWGLRARTPIHLSREARHLHRGPGPGLVPLGEAKLAALLDPRAATWRDGLPAARAATPTELADPSWLPATRWWVPEWLVQERYGDLLERGWLGAYRVVCTDRTPRTLLPVALPGGAYANSLALLAAPRLPLLLAALASIPLDYAARAKIGGNNLNLFKVEQLPVPSPATYDAAWSGSLTPWMLDRFALAVAWCDRLTPLADELRVRPAVSTASQRRQALAELDAVHAHLFGWTSADLEHVLGTFPALRAADEARHGSFLTRRLVLEAFDRLSERFTAAPLTPAG